MTKGIRRSDRVHVRIPILIRGIDTDGLTFSEKGAIITVSKHGAAIELGRPLSVGTPITIHTAHSLEFEAVVVWIGTASSKTIGQAGIECAGLADSLGFHFPSD